MLGESEGEKALSFFVGIFYSSGYIGTVGIGRLERKVSNRTVDGLQAESNLAIERRNKSIVFLFLWFMPDSLLT